jgi:hypothetical protein
MSPTNSDSSKSSVDDAEATVPAFATSMTPAARQRLANAFKQSANAVSAASPGLRSFWSRINLVSPDTAINNIMSSTPFATSAVSGADTEGENPSARPGPHVINPIPTTTQSSDFIEFLASDDAEESTTRLRALLDSSTDYSSPPLVVSATDERRSVTDPSTVNEGGLTVNLPVESNTKDNAESPLFATSSASRGSSPGFTSPFNMKNTGSSVFNSDLHPKAYGEEGYHRSSIVSSVTEGDVDVGLVRALEASTGTDHFVHVKVEDEKARIREEAARLADFKKAHDEFQAALNPVMENVVDSTPAVPPKVLSTSKAAPSRVVEPAVEALSASPVVSTKPADSKAVKSEPSLSDISALLSSVMEANEALSKSNEKLLAEVVALKSGVASAPARSTGSTVDDEGVPNEYDTTDPWLVVSKSSRSPTGGSSKDMMSAPARLVRGDHGSQSMPGWSGLEPATYMDVATAPPYVSDGPPMPVSSVRTSEPNGVTFSPLTEAIPTVDRKAAPAGLFSGPDDNPNPPSYGNAFANGGGSPGGGSGGGGGSPGGGHGAPSDSSSSSGGSNSDARDHTFKVGDGEVVFNCFVADDEIPAVPPGGPGGYPDDGDLTVVTPKDKRLNISDYGYEKQRGWLTQSLELQFGVYEFAVTEKKDRGNVTTSGSIVDRYDSHLAKLKKTKTHLHNRDILQLTYVPATKPGVDLDMPESQLRLVTRHEVFINGGRDCSSILSSWGDIKWKDVVFWQRTINVKNVNLSIYEKQSSRILFEILRKSCTSDFWDEIVKVGEKSGLNEDSWGGVTCLYLCITTLFYAPEHVLEALRNDIRSFEKVGLTKTEGENVKVKTKHLLRITKALYQSRGLQNELEGCIVRGFQNCSNEALRDHFVQAQRATVKELMALRMNRSDSAQLTQKQIHDRIVYHCDEAVTLYEALCLNRQYINGKGAQLQFMKASTPRQLTPKVTCDNCLENHYVNECPKDRDEDAISRNRKARVEKQKQNKTDKDRKSNADEVPTRDKNGNSSGSTIIHHKAPRVMNGKVEVYCNKCEKWTDHSTRFHKAAQKPGFNLADASPNSPAAQLQAELDAAKSSPAAAASSSAAAASAPSRSALTTIHFKAFTDKQNSLNEAIVRHGATSILGMAAKTQLDALNAEFSQNFG